jgi:hypothetical protein
LNTLRLKGPRKAQRPQEERRKEEEKTKRIAAKAKVLSFDLKTKKLKTMAERRESTGTMYCTGTVW